MINTPIEYLIVRFLSPTSAIVSIYIPILNRNSEFLHLQNENKKEFSYFFQCYWNKSTVFINIIRLFLIFYYTKRWHNRKKSYLKATLRKVFRFHLTAFLKSNKHFVTYVSFESAVFHWKNANYVETFSKGGEGLKDFQFLTFFPSIINIILLINKNCGVWIHILAKYIFPSEQEANE